MVQEDIYLKKLELHINKLLKKDIYKDRNIEYCPICSCKKYIKYGLYNQIQRYKCKECGKTFSNTTNSLWSYSKKNPKLWIEFIELMMEKKSLRFCAEKLNINLVTAFYWRHKVLHVLASNAMPNALKGNIHIGNTIMRENFKGCRNIPTSVKTSRTRNIWIIGLKGQEDSMLIKPICKDVWDLKKFNEKIYSKIEKESYIIPYGDRYLSLVAKKHNKKLSIDVADDHRIKYFILNLNNWLKVFRGIATKYLEKYLSFFILFNLDRIVDYMNMISYDLFFENRFIKTNEIRIIQDCNY